MMMIVIDDREIKIGRVRLPSMEKMHITIKKVLRP
jgi:hypothetical protein